MTMPSMIKTLLLVAALLMGIACNDPLVPPSAVAHVTVSPSPATVLIGGTRQLVARLEDAAGNVLTGRVLTWGSGNTAVATVNSTGLVTGVAAGGPVTIAATSEGQSGTAAITVTPVPVASVTVAPTSATVLFGQTDQLTATTKDANGNELTGRTVTWASGDPAVATVSATGLVTGIAAGQATITATSEGRGGTAAITVAVLSFATVSAGDDHTCGVTTGGPAYCWGNNGLGQLGNGTTTNSATPAVVAGGLAFTAVSASTGSFTCGLTRGGAAYCWGADQLGTGSRGRSSVPVAVTGGHSFAALTTGYDHTCALTANGTAYCWGYNQFDQLGTGPGGGPQFCDAFPCSTAPTAVSGGLTFAAVSASTGALGFTCSLTPGGAAYCWGYNADGELGNGTTTNSATPLAVGGGFTFAAVTTGAYHSCGLTKDGAAYCWGDNEDGELGDGSYTETRWTPVAVSGGLTFAAVSAGLFNTCGITTSGVLYCWGKNGAGELGIGSATGPQVCYADEPDYVEPCSTVPVAVSGGLKFAVVSVADYYTCGMTSGGAAYCWGVNYDGQLGTGTTTSSPVPVKVAGQP